MNQASRIILSLSMIYAACTSTLAMAAEEHERPHSEMHAPAPRSAPRVAPGRAAFDGRGQVLDSRYNHGRYYPPAGTVRATLPEGYRPYFHGGNRYYFNGGVWYAPRGPGFVVVQPPIGVFVSVLPAYYSTVWFGGVPYYYADNVYYTWQPEQNGYVVADPPTNPDVPSPPPPDQTQSDLIIYPKNGQTKEQQSADQFECHNWAKGQTGFDPTQPGGGVSGNPDMVRNNYNRAMSACLQGRGYQVN